MILCTRIQYMESIGLCIESERRKVTRSGKKTKLLLKSPDQWVITQEMTSANLRYGNVPKTTRHPRALKNSLNSI